MQRLTTFLTALALLLFVQPDAPFAQPTDRPWATDYATVEEAALAVLDYVSAENETYNLERQEAGNWIVSVGDRFRPLEPLSGVEDEGRIDLGDTPDTVAGIYHTHPQDSFRFDRATGRATQPSGHSYVDISLANRLQVLSYVATPAGRVFLYDGATRASETLLRPNRAGWATCNDDCQGAGSNGEPHLRTGDGLAYDFQAVGDFVLAKSLDDDFAVQVRQAPYRRSRSLSVNVAVAASVAGDRIGLTIDGRNLTIRLDGALLAPTSSGVNLPGGGRIELPRPYEARLEWPDGSVLKAFSYLGWLDLRLLLPPARFGRVAGLLGDFDGDPENDLSLRGGDPVVLPRPSSRRYRRLLYEEFGESWRLSADESLFDYAAGEGSETFHDRSFPESIVTVDTLAPPDRERAAAACVAAGVVDADVLEGCTLDVAATGEIGFAEAAAVFSRAIERPTRVASNGDPLIHLMAFAITDASPSFEERFWLNAGSSVYIRRRDVSGTLDLSDIRVFDPSGLRLGRRCVACTEFGAVETRRSGWHRFEATREGDESGRVAYERFIVSAPQVFFLGPTLEIDDAMRANGAGSIETRGALDVYEVSLAVGDRLRIAVARRDPTLGFARWTLLAPDGATLQEAGLPAATAPDLTAAATVAGPYRIVVDGGRTWPAGEDFGYGSYSIAFERRR